MWYAENLRYGYNWTPFNTYETTNLGEMDSVRLKEAGRLIEVITLIETLITGRLIGLPVL